MLRTVSGSTRTQSHFENHLAIRRPSDIRGHALLPQCMVPLSSPGSGRGASKRTREAEPEFTPNPQLYAVRYADSIAHVPCELGETSGSRRQPTLARPLRLDDGGILPVPAGKEQARVSNVCYVSRRVPRERKSRRDTQLRLESRI